MISIQSIASYIPAGFESNAEKMEKFGFDEAFLKNKIGVESVPRMAADEETSDMCVEAFKSLQGKADVSVEDVELIIVCTQNPDGHGMPQTSAVVHAKLGAPTSCASFDISLACSGYVYSLAVAKAFMEANGLKTGLLFTSDPYSKILDPEDRDTTLLFGDAATVTLLSAARSGIDNWIPKAFRFYTDGKLGPALNNSAGTFHMNGLAVVTFSVREVPKEVRSLMEEHSLSKEDVDLFLFHQGSKYIVDQLRRRLELTEAQVPIRLRHCGNTVSSSVPLVLEEYLEQRSIRRILCSGFGVGLSIATGLLENQRT